MTVTDTPTIPDAVTAGDVAQYRQRLINLLADATGISLQTASWRVDEMLTGLASEPTTLEATLFTAGQAARAAALQAAAMGADDEREVMSVAHRWAAWILNGNQTPPVGWMVLDPDSAGDLVAWDGQVHTERDARRALALAAEKSPDAFVVVLHRVDAAVDREQLLPQPGDTWVDTAAGPMLRRADEGA